MIDKQTQRVAFNIVLACFGLLFFWVIKPYLGMLVIGLVIAFLFDPLYQKLVKKFRGRTSWAAFICTWLVVLCLIIPIIVVLSIAANQALAFANLIQKNIASGAISLDNLKIFLENLARRLPGDVDWDTVQSIVKLESLLITVGGKMADLVSAQAVDLLQNSLKIFTDFMVFVFVMYYLFPDKERILRKLTQLSPLDDEEDAIFIRRFESMSRSILKGNFLIAIVQGVLGGTMFAILGLPSAVFWGMMMMVCSLIPLGSGLIWIPAGMILLIVGSYVKGIILLLFGFAVISTIDNVIRAKILEKEETHLPPLVTLVSVLGGIKVFGFIGFLYGPMIAMLCLTAVEMYQERQNQHKFVPRYNTKHHKE
ncbi:MAG TPA: AI-2E family transporter [bacterium]|nr:AI-2E family transporter [bacterium]